MSEWFCLESFLFRRQPSCSVDPLVSAPLDLVVNLSTHSRLCDVAKARLTCVDLLLSMQWLVCTNYAQLSCAIWNKSISLV